MRRQIAAERGDPHGGSAAKKGRRAAVFAQWLVDTYEVPYLKSGSGNVRARSWSELCPVLQYYPDNQPQLSHSECLVIH